MCSSRKCRVEKIFQYKNVSTLEEKFRISLSGHVMSSISLILHCSKKSDILIFVFFSVIWTSIFFVVMPKT